MITVNEMLKTIKQEMENKISTGSGRYNTDPSIGKGFIAWNNAPAYPFLGFYAEEIEEEEFIGDEILGRITVTFYGHAEADDDEYNNDETLIELMTDLQYFIKNDSTHKNQWKQSTPFTTAGSEYNGKTILSFTVSYSVMYEATVTTVNE